jgi:AmmeMemoRadiSam system protein B
MHLPFIKKVFADEGKPDVKLVPLMVGEIPKAKYKDYAKKLINLFKDERTVFIVSSDFCHWGSNFDYYRLHPETPDGEISKSIEKLDREGMSLIESHSLAGFMAYLKDTKNTICGRNPIQLLLALIEEAGASNYETSFIAYA